MNTPLLSIRDLEVRYPSPGLGKSRAVVRDVSMDIKKGETLGLVGESGSGKSTIGRAILGLAPVSQGKILFEGVDLTQLTRRQRREKARGIQVIFQDPYSSLNPSMTIEDILTEPLTAAGDKSGRSRVRDLLDSVGLPANAGARLAKEFSGGQRQRIAIARALALDPALIVCDEPTSALDMSTQAKVLELLTALQERTGVSYLFISHDLAVVARMADRTAVLLEGQIVEMNTSREVATRPSDPYTKRLQMAAPVADPREQRKRREARRQTLNEGASA